MIGRAPVRKSLCYVTSGARLLVLRQPHVRGAGDQVPGGTVEPGESPRAAALREAEEETGLSAFTLVAFLGSALYRPRVDPGPDHRRHFYHLTHPATDEDTWRHHEVRLSGAPARVFELHWIPLVEVCLDWEMDRYLELVMANARP